MVSSLFSEPLLVVVAVAAVVLPLGRRLVLSPLSVLSELLGAAVVVALPEPPDPALLFPGGWGLAVALAPLALVGLAAPPKPRVVGQALRPGFPFGPAW